MKITWTSRTTRGTGKMLIQPLLFMKITGILLTIACLQVSANSFSQKVSFSGTDVPLEKVFSMIEKQSGYFFFYRYSELQQARPVSLNVKDASVEQVLDICLKGQPFTWSVEGKTIVISMTPSSQDPPAPKKQEREISGIVTDSTGIALPGVTVRIKNKNQGVATDEKGGYTINVPDENTVLVFSYLGFESKEITVGNSTVIDVVMREDAMGLDEVVVVGYGTQSNAKVTSSISQISSEELQVDRRPVTNIQSALVGSVPGLIVNQSNGQPGTLAGLRIRGLSSTNEGGPLVLIDGFQGSVRDLHPGMIKSISVLKDASAAAIYGSRAANGVILITTKSGRRNLPLSLTYSANFSMQDPPRIPSTVNSLEFMQMYNEAQINDGTSPEEVKYSQEDMDRAASGYYPETIWPRELYNSNAGQRSHSLIVSGGSANTSYSLGLGRIVQQGLIKGADDYRLNSIRVKLESDITEWLTVGTNSELSSRTTTSVPGLGNSALRGLPFFPVQTEDGTYVYKGGTGVPNPVAAAQSGSFDERGSDTYDIRLFAKVSPLKNLVLEQKVVWFKNGVNRKNWNNTFSYVVLDERDLSNVLSTTPATAQSRSMFMSSYVREDIQTLTTLRYQLQKGNHFGSALLGFQTREWKTELFSAERNNFALDNLPSLNLGQEVQGLGNNSSQTGNIATASLFGRLNYDFQGKYLLEFSFRYDGSSKFAPDNRFGFFPSVSAGWNIAQEDFMQNVDFIDRLKLRASWGQLGDAGGVGAFETTQLINFNPIGYPFNGQIYPQLSLAGPINPNLTWETAEITNFGLDMVFWGGKLSVTPEYYINNRSNILDNLVVPVEYGLGNVPGNVYSARSWGWELNISHRNRIGDAGYFARFNISDYKSKVTDLQGRGPFISESQYTDEGLPIRNYYGYKTDGYFDTQQEIDAHEVDQSAVARAYLGGIKYADLNNDGRVTPDDRIIIDENQATFRTGLTLGASYKNFSISTHLYGVLNRNERWTGNTVMQFFPWQIAPLGLHTDHWTSENQDALFPSIEITQTNMPFSTHWYKDAEYIKVKNINLSYKFGEKLLNKIGVVEALTLYYSIENLGTLWTNYPAFEYGWDPELGVNNIAYPLPVTHAFGFNIKF